MIADWSNSKNHSIWKGKDIKPNTLCSLQIWSQKHLHLVFLLGMWQIFDLYSIRTRIVPFSPEFCNSVDYCPPNKFWVFIMFIWDFLGEMAFIMTINKCCSTSTCIMPLAGTLLSVNGQHSMQPSHEELDERPLCGIYAGRSKHEGKKKKKAENSVEFF